MRKDIATNARRIPNPRAGGDAGRLAVLLGMMGQAQEAIDAFPERRVQVITRALFPVRVGQAPQVGGCVPRGWGSHSNPCQS